MASKDKDPQLEIPQTSSEQQPGTERENQANTRAISTDTTDLDVI